VKDRADFSRVSLALSGKRDLRDKIAPSKWLTRRDMLLGSAALIGGFGIGRGEAETARASIPLVVDASVRCSDAAVDLFRAGVKAVVRYYARGEQPGFGEKILTSAEAEALFEAGLGVALSYQHYNSKIESFNETAAHEAAAYCLARDARSGKPHKHGLIHHPNGTVIYFGIDNDFPPITEIKDVRGRRTKTIDNDDIIKRYFEIINGRFKGSPFKVGVYGPGRFCRMLAEAQPEPLASHFWLPGSTGWAETPEFYNNKHKGSAWNLYQKAVEVPFEFKPNGDANAPVRTLRVDTNMLNAAAGGSFGAFKGSSLMDPIDDSEVRGRQRFLASSERFLKTAGGEAFAWMVERVSGANRRIVSTSDLPARKMVSLLGVTEDKHWAQIEAISTERNSLAESEKGVVRAGYVPAASLVSIAKMPV
jgi:Rv2525c-like, glycoside hydrolase-like domain